MALLPSVAMLSRARWVWRRPSHSVASRRQQPLVARIRFDAALVAVRCLRRRGWHRAGVTLRPSMVPVPTKLNAPEARRRADAHPSTPARQRCSCAPRRRAAAEAQVERVVAPVLALAAEVVEVEAAVAAVAVEGALGGAAERKRDAIVGAQPLRHRVRDEVEIAAEALCPAQRRGLPGEHHRQAPWLVVEVDARVDVARVGHPSARAC